MDNFLVKPVGLQDANQTKLQRQCEDANRQIFGNEQFRPHQLEIVQSVINGNDCFVIMPTGTIIESKDSNAYQDLNLHTYLHMYTYILT